MTGTQDTLLSVTSTRSDFATFGRISLDVTDVERALFFWRDLVGLALLDRGDEGLRLGVAGRTLVVLRPGARGPVVREASGLYHVSLHLPSLSDFARAFTRFEAAEYAQFPTDHGTHLANYVDDPDGIGLEFAFETPAELRATWNDLPGFERGEHGWQWRPRDPRYLAWLRSHVPDGDGASKLRAGTIVGHVHLRVEDIDAALAFYRDVMGFTVNADGRQQGFFDMSAGGIFPHRLACNSWESAGRPQRPADAAGMRWFSLEFRSTESRNRAVTRVRTAGGQIEDQRGDTLVIAPDGTRIVLTRVEAA